MRARAERGADGEREGGREGQPLLATTEGELDWVADVDWLNAEVWENLVLPAGNFVHLHGCWAKRAAGGGRLV